MKMRIKGLKKNISCFLALILALSLIPVQAAKPIEVKADDTGLKNAYILEVATGINDGSCIEFFEIRYEGTDGKQYMKVLLPGEDALSNSRKEAHNYGSDDKVTDDLEWNLSYRSTVDPYALGPGSGLKSYSVDQYYFTTDVEIGKIIKVDGFIGKQGVWTCLRFQIFKVDKLGGLRIAGLVSDTYYVDFEGDLIAEIKGGNNNWSDDDANYLHMTQKASLITEFKNVPYAHHSLQSGTKEYGFRFDFADIYGAGFECLAAEYEDGKNNAFGLELAETLALAVTYTDVYGNSRFVRIPAVLCSALYAYYNNITDPISGLAGQGESIAFSGTLPDCSYITDVSIMTGAAEASSATKIVYDAWVNALYDSWGGGRAVSGNIHKRRVNSSESDDIRLTLSAVYDMKDSKITPYMDGAVLRYRFEGNPILYHISSDVTGELFYAKTSGSLNLKEYAGGTLDLSDNKEYFLVQFTADEILSAATETDMYLTLRYRKLNGSEAVSSEISLRDASRDYFGYWPADTEDFAYKSGVSSGNTVSALVSLADVDRFTGLEIRMEDDRDEDDYQFKNLRIYALSGLGKRTVQWKDMTVGNKHSHLMITRNITGVGTSVSQGTGTTGTSGTGSGTGTGSSSGTGTSGGTEPGAKSAVKILDVNDTILVQGGNTIPVDFNSAEVGTISDKKWEISNYSVTYAEAMQNFGFTKARKTYTVTVNVFDDIASTDENGKVVSSGGNGDAGSENLFYFQLVFKNGSSPYVLANQQIKGDKFVSGRPAVFQISTNQNYGDLVNIRIIPDDTSEDSKKYDKLRIDSIYVTESEAQGTHSCWVCENVGWVGVGYTQEQELSGMGGRRGRTAAEMSKNVPVDYISNVVQLEVAIRTSAGEQMEGSADQFRGNLFANINYIKSNGERDSTGDMDVVALMYQFMNKTGSADSDGNISRTSNMFRENHTDRFFVNIMDVRQLVSMDLSMYQKDDPYTWYIGGVSIKLITEEGRLTLNKFEEYEYQRSEEPQLVCTQKSETIPAHYAWLKHDGQVKLNIPLSENSIELADNTYAKASVLTKEPASNNDELNLYVFPTLGRGSSINDYDLDAEIYYAHAYGTMYETGTRLTRYNPVNDTDRPMFYVKGLNASGMVDVNRLRLTADSAENSIACLDYAIIQQVRSGTVIASYFVDLNDLDAFYTVEKFPSANANAIGYQDSQTLTLQFGDGTEAKNLFSDRQDIAVALKFKLANDPLDTEYTTPYTFLTEQDVIKIRAGQVIDVNFKQMFAGEITGVTFASVGDVAADIYAAGVTTYRTDKAGNKEEENYYSFAESLNVTLVPGTMRRTSTAKDEALSVRPVTLTFVTSSATDNYESGSSDPVWMRLYTVDKDGNVITPYVEKEDIRKYLTDGSGNFATGQKQTVKFLVVGAAGLRRIVLEPRSKEGLGNAGWSVDTVSAQLGSDPVISRTVHERIYEGDARSITLSNITVSAEVFNYNAAKDTYDMMRVQAEGAKLIALPEKEFYIDPMIFGSELGIDVYAVEVTDGEFVSGHLTDLLTLGEDGIRWTFNPPKDKDTKYYRITVASAEVPTSKLEIDITVKGVEDGGSEAGYEPAGGEKQGDVDAETGGESNE